MKMGFKTVTKTIVIDKATSWELILLFNRFDPQVSKAIRDKMFLLTWELQDGYGEPGFTPIQGWDWSGIRDSSDKAKRKIGSCIRSFLKINKIKSITYKERVWK